MFIGFFMKPISLNASAPSGRLTIKHGASFACVRMTAYERKIVYNPVEEAPHLPPLRARFGGTRFTKDGAIDYLRLWRLSLTHWI